MSPLCSTCAAVAPHLPHQMAAVEVAQIRTFSGGASAPPSHDGLQIFIGGLVFLKGQNIQKQKKNGSGGPLPAAGMSGIRSYCSL